MMESGPQTTDEKELLVKSARLVVQRQEASCSLLQREFGIDFMTAVRVMMEMERCGIVGEFDGVDTRKVLEKTEEEACKKMQLPII